MTSLELQRVTEIVQRMLITITPIYAEKKIESDTNLFEIGLLDSFSIIELITKLESEFNFEIPYDKIDFTVFSSIEEISRFVLSINVDRGNSLN
jgi:acyl carrier protein